MSKKIFCLFLVFWSSSIAYSQVLHHCALTTAGTSYTNGGVSLHFATGQLSNMHYDLSGTNFYEGLLQPLQVAITTSIATPGNSFTFNIFPNPATDALYITHRDMPTLHFNIYNINGAVVKQGIAVNSIEIKSLQEGIYYLKLFNSLGESIYSFKFIKT